MTSYMVVHVSVLKIAEELPLVTAFILPHMTKKKYFNKHI
jgi:hypothetical protein